MTAAPSTIARRERAARQEAARTAKREADRAAHPAEHYHPGGCYDCHSFAGPIQGCDCAGCTPMRGHHPERTLRYGQLVLASQASEAKPVSYFAGTDKQRNFVRALIRTRQLSERANRALAHYGGDVERYIDSLNTRDRVSGFIDTFKDAPVAAHAVVAETVSGHLGRFVKDSQGWRVRIGGKHDSGEVVTVRKANGDEQSVTLAVAVGDLWTFADHDDKGVVPLADMPDVPKGHYAIDSKGHNDTLFVRVDRPEETTVRIKMVIGGRPDATMDRKRYRDVLERIVEAGVQEAAFRYGREIERCCRCNRHLTDKSSRDAGIGPECEKKAW